MGFIHIIFGIYGGSEAEAAHIPEAIYFSDSVLSLPAFSSVTLSIPTLSESTLSLPSLSASTLEPDNGD